MLPILLDLKFIKIYTFGVFLVLAFFWGLFVLWRNIKLTSYKEEEMFDGVFISLLWAIFFSRLLYVAFNFKHFRFDVLKFILVNGYPGLSAYGALLGGFFGLFVFLKSKKIDFLKAVDYFMPALLVAFAVAYIGSFFAAVDVGTKTNFFLAIKYVGYQGNRHITPLYQAILLFGGSFIAYKAVLLIRRQKLPQGFAWYFFLFYFALANLLLDKLKQNHLYFAGFNFNLILSAVITVVGGSYFIYFFRAEIMNYVKKNYQRVNAQIKKRAFKNRTEPQQKN